MNTQRLVVLGLALVAAAGAAFMVRSMLGGGTPQVEAKPQPAPIAMSEVLVADANLTPGQKLLVEQVRWEKWPTTSVDASFVTHANAGSEETPFKIHLFAKVATEQRSGECTGINAHVKNGIGSILTLVTILIKLANHCRDIGLKKTVTEYQQPEAAPHHGNSSAFISIMGK